jgi:transcription-repair coupling factor (superfamily II helicase)
VSRFSPDLIQEAVQRELRRGGQVFFIHNRVQSIDRMAASLTRILPGVRIEIAHGQMEGRKLEAVMSRFRGGECDLLLCTAIVESGLDIPNANTMIINRADIIGLAELYQLRGRVGRSSHRAYAYLLIPGEGILTPAAKRRIEVLRDFSHLGAGFQIAVYDLEIRGAGSVIGYRQSGHIAAIGFELYTQLLRETIQELRGEPAAEERLTQVSVALSDYLPEDYIPEIGLRLSYYKKIAASRTEAALKEVARELRERFGPLPDPARHLLWAATLRLEGEAVGARKLEWRSDSFTFSLYPGSRVTPEAMAALLKRAPPGSGLRGAYEFAWKWRSAVPDDRFAEAADLLRSLR